MKKKIDISITEVFMAKCGRNGWDKCFSGTIRRERDDDGNLVVFGKIKINDGYIYATAPDQWVLGEKLDSMVEMIVDKKLHSNPGKSIKITESEFILN